MNIQDIKTSPLLDMPLMYNIIMTKFTEEHKRRISESLKGKPRPWQLKTKIVKICPCGEIFYLTPGQVRKGHGKYCSRKCSYKYQHHPNFLKYSKLKGKYNVNWKGILAKYSALHLRVQKERGIAIICESCGSTTKVEWANLTGDYNNVMDYKSLCKKCHNILDDIYKKGWITRKNKSSTPEANGKNTREGGGVSA
jgi:DNA-directed RNA polymerase subunit M/transcription elongation factor TFIIS